jgi:putative transposase
MKGSRFSEEPFSAFCGSMRRERQRRRCAGGRGISEATCYKWQAKYGGLEVSKARRSRSLDDENRRLKKLWAEAMLDNAALQARLGKNG